MWVGAGCNSRPALLCPPLGSWMIPIRQSHDNKIPTCGGSAVADDTMSMSGGAERARYGRTRRRQPRRGGIPPPAMRPTHRLIARRVGIALFGVLLVLGIRGKLSGTAVPDG